MTTPRCCETTVWPVRVVSVVPFIVAFLLADTEAAAARPDRLCERPQLRAQVVEILVDTKSTPPRLALHPSVSTIVQVVSGHQALEVEAPIDIGFANTQRGAILEVLDTYKPQPHAIDTSHGVLRFTTADSPIALDLRIVPDAVDALAIAYIRSRTPADADRPDVTHLGSLCALAADHIRELDKLDADYREKFEEQQAEHDREREAQALSNARRLDRAMLSEISDGLRDLPLKDTTCKGDGIQVCEPRMMVIGREGVLRITAHNRTVNDAVIVGVRVYNDEGKDLVKSIDVGGRHSKRKLDDPPLQVLRAYERVTASVKLGDPDQISDRITVQLMGPSNALLATVDYDQMDMLDRAHFERLERLREAAIEREAKRSSLHVFGSIGAIWLPSGVNGDDTTAAAPLTSVGIRWTEGLSSHHLAIEVDALVATSGQADFGTMTVDGTTGDLTRTVRLGRMSGGLIARFGEIDTPARGEMYAIPPKVVPHLRFGAAAQVAAPDSTLMTDGGEMAGPDEGVAVDLGFYAGAGLDIRLGTNWIVGAGVTITRAPQPIVDLGLQAAYRWDP